jgi:nitrite reductase/ring-hydroxylating ferredoxin subunit
MRAMTELVLTEPAAREIVTHVAPPNPGQSVRVPFGDTFVAVFNSGGALYGVEASCGHRKGPLDQGTVVGAAVACPWHGAKFDLRTGEVVGGNFFIRRSTRPIRTFRVRVEAGQLALSERSAREAEGSARIDPPTAVNRTLASRPAARDPA